jgi:hypothetical protein
LGDLEQQAELDTEQTAWDPRLRAFMRRPQPVPQPVTPRPRPDRREEAPPAESPLLAPAAPAAAPAEAPAAAPAEAEAEAPNRVRARAAAAEPRTPKRRNTEAVAGARLAIVYTTLAADRAADRAAAPAPRLPGGSGFQGAALAASAWEHELVSREAGAPLLAAMRKTRRLRGRKRSKLGRGPVFPVDPHRGVELLANTLLLRATEFGGGGAGDESSPDASPRFDPLEPIQLRQ